MSRVRRCEFLFLSAPKFITIQLVSSTDVEIPCADFYRGVYVESSNSVI